MEPNKDFLPFDSNYDSLIAFQKAECIYDVTFHFAHRFLNYKDRTVDQMVQSARSGKQNIAEGMEAYSTSKETGIRLVNVAKGSLQELKNDYKDYLRVRELELWSLDSEKGSQCRRACYKHNDSAYYREAVKVRGDEAIANIAITLIYQCDVLLRGLLEALKKDFLENGGIKEEMTRARLQHRNQNKEKKD